MVFEECKKITDWKECEGLVISCQMSHINSFLKEIKEFWRNNNKYKEILMYFNNIRGKKIIFEEFQGILKKIKNK